MTDEEAGLRLWKPHGWSLEANLSLILPPNLGG